MAKFINLWDYENEFEGKQKAGAEISLTDENRIRELREKRLIMDKETYDKRNPPVVEKKVTKKKTE